MLFFNISLVCYLHVPQTSFFDRYVFEPDLPRLCDSVHKDRDVLLTKKSI